MHPFPARMAPDLALRVLKRGATPLRVLDPMAGSGTVLAVAQESGHIGIGRDLDPLAVMAARVWTNSVDPDRLMRAALRTLARAESLADSLRIRDCFPLRCDTETRQFIRYWFDSQARRQLAALSHSIRRIRSVDVRDAIWCAFSRLIIVKSLGASRARDLAHSRPHRSFERAPQLPFAGFLRAVENVIAGLPASPAGARKLATDVDVGDARDLALPPESIDLVLTSPPYLNAIDYVRCSKFSLVWMGYTIESLRDVRSMSVGTEVGLDSTQVPEWTRSFVTRLGLRPQPEPRTLRMVFRYVIDMDLAVSEVARVLRPGGRAVYVVGDSTVRGTFIPNSAIVRRLAVRHGLAHTSTSERDLPPQRRYLPPPTVERANGLGSRMRREAVIRLRKPR